jgi:hypothetical protein
MLKSFALCLTVACLAVVPASLIAQQKQGKQKMLKMKEAKPGLLSQAKISAADALKTAQAKAPGEKVASEQIEEENGKLVYSFDFEAAGKTGRDEVNVDANTGEVVKIEHESAATEAAEKTGHATKTAADTVASKTKKAAKATGKAIKTAADTVKNRF